MTVQYTDYLPVNSSAVDDLYFNGNDNTLVVDWDDSLYRYYGVTRAEAQAVQIGQYGGQPASHPSVGRAAQVLKTAKGPGEYLGNYNDVDFERVLTRPAAGVPKDFTTATFVKEYSLGEPAVSGAVATNSTKEFSLQPVALAPENLEPDDVVTLFFTLDGAEMEYEFEADSTDVQEAINELNEYVSRLKARGRVLRAVVEFA
jgi:hypothetical protein